MKFIDANEPTYTWSGHLPPKIYKNPIYSNKVFLGGVPWDITEGNHIVKVFKKCIFMLFVLIYHTSFLFSWITTGLQTFWCIEYRMARKGWKA